MGKSFSCSDSVIVILSSFRIILPKQEFHWTMDTAVRQKKLYLKQSDASGKQERAAEEARYISSERTQANDKTSNSEDQQ